MHHRSRLWLVAALTTIVSIASPAFADVDAALEKVRAIGAKGTGHAEAAQAIGELCQGAPADLAKMLDAIAFESDIANNWIRGAIDAVVDRAAQSGNPPTAAMVEYVNDKTKLPAARYIAFNALSTFEAEKAESLVPGLLNDPSLDLRRKAVAIAIDKAEQVSDDKKDDRIAAFQFALQSARDVDQIESISESLKAVDAEPNLVDHFGFVTKWHLVGPFDNTGSKSFDVVYAPEKANVDLTAKYEGQNDEVTWKEHSSDDTFGIVDLNKALDNHKGAIAYAFAEFDSPTAADIEIRMGCINANKIWLNRKLLTANEVYHSGMVIDQYAGRGKLKQGKNTILVKLCQNEQTEEWAQRWQFQLRVCDSLGTAIHSRK